MCSGTIDGFENMNNELRFIIYVKGLIRMTTLYKEAGERILLVRVMRGYTRECLAEMASISPKFLYEIETGRKGFSAIVLHKLCSALQVDSDYILTGTEKVEYDQKLVDTLQLFDQSQTERLSIIMEKIYELL